MSKIADDSLIKIKALDELFAQSRVFKGTREYLDLLGFINRFPDLSPFNAFLISVQNNGVSVVMSTSKWRRYNRVPKPKARPMIILVPFGPVEFVFDIAETTGDAIPDALMNPFHTSGRVNPFILTRVIENLKKDGVGYEEYQMHKGSAGYAKSDTGFKVAVNSGYGPEEKISTIVHELGHIYCGHLGATNESWWNRRSDLSHAIKEIEAESVSYLVCKRLHLKTSSEQYLSNYVTDNPEVPDLSLDTILVVAGYIESMLKPGFKKKSKTSK